LAIHHYRDRRHRTERRYQSTFAYCGLRFDAGSTHPDASASCGESACGTNATGSATNTISATSLIASVFGFSDISQRRAAAAASHFS